MKEIFSRRSIRKYTNKEITEDILKQILKAGMNAPTAKNMKPFQFIVIQDKQILEELSNMKKNSYFVKDSNATIVVLGKETTDYWQQDLGAVTQNILLEAAHFDIGSCWVGVAPREDYEDYARKLLNIPNDIRVFCLISLGYSNESKEKNDKYYTERVHYDKY